MTTVDVVMGDEKLMGNDKTMLEVGISADTALQVLFTIKPIECYSFCTSGVDKEDLLVVSIPESDTCIDECAFLGCDFLAKVIIPPSVTEIEDSAFESCTSLTFGSFWCFFPLFRDFRAVSLRASGSFS